ncbi:MAG TPA: sigma-70 family RNA polymerase sigma factor [Candidatus Acidoferrum sp.]|nr:sigma-70 family RNA polymerase sigma factor [Candidatus Acidoferrum sp.]
MPREPNAREDDLLRRAVRGDEDAFLQIYRAHQPTLYRYALRMTGRPWTAEEMVQEVFLTLLRESGRFDPSRGALGAFLFGIARNHVRKHLERSPNELQLDESGELPEAGSAVYRVDGNRLANPAVWTEQRQRSEQLRRAILEIPEEFREAIVLCDLEELSYEAAAHLLGCPIGTVRSRLHRGRALLMARMEILRERPRKAAAP